MAVVSALLAMLGGLALVTAPMARRVGDHLVTIAHEAGHAVAAVLCNHGRVSGIELHSDAGSIRTGYRGRTFAHTSRRGQVLVGASGYPAPAALGLAVLALLHGHRTKGLLAAMVAALVVLLFLIRNIFGAFLLLAIGAALYLTFLYGSRTTQNIVVGVLAWNLLFGACGSAIGVLLDGGQTGDAAYLATMTGTRAELWALLFVLLTVGMTGYAVWLTLISWN